MKTVVSKQLYLIIRLAAFFCLFSSCSSPENKFQSKLDEQMLVITHSLSDVHSLADLQDRELQLKESFLRLANLLIQVQAHSSSDLEPSPSLTSEALRKELERLYKIEGMRFEVEKIQQPALEVFAGYFQKRQ